MIAGRMNDEEFALFNEFLSREFGIIFPEHKREMLQSRLAPRLVHHRFTNYFDYYTYLQYDSNGERSQLIRAVTNNESYFFRETHQFDALVEHALPELKAAAGDARTIRFLCAGCSSGEEPYSLNIFLRENLYRMFGYSVEIDAFDLNQSRVETARNAEYSQVSMRGATAEQVQKYFLASNGTFTLRPMYRADIRFRVANLLRSEAYLGTYDVIFCRNVLIYFSEETSRLAVARFAAALRPGGILFLGHSESIIGVSPLFEPVRFGNGIAYRRVLQPLVS